MHFPLSSITVYLYELRVILLKEKRGGFEFRLHHHVVVIKRIETLMKFFFIWKYVGNGKKVKKKYFRSGQENGLNVPIEKSMLSPPKQEKK